jgi:hypothetical protein
MNYKRLQAWVLRLVGIVELLAFVSVVMPRAWMDACHAALGPGELPPGPVFDAVMRQTSFTYGLHGVGLWFMAVDVARYRPLVWLTGVGYLLAGPAFIAIDLCDGLPWFWAAGNGGSCVLIGALVLGLLWAERKGREPKATMA